MFTLHPQLQKDSVLVGDFPLSLLLLSRDANYPWCVLVPKRAGLREIYELDEADRQQLLLESCELSEVMQSLFSADKMNVAALGNMVPQLHLHHIARYEGDAAWPGPIWGEVEPVPYSEDELLKRITAIRQAFDQGSLVLKWG